MNNTREKLKDLIQFIENDYFVRESINDNGTTGDYFDDEKLVKHIKQQFKEELNK